MANRSTRAHRRRSPSWPSLFEDSSRSRSHNETMNRDEISVTARAHFIVPAGGRRLKARAEASEASVCASDTGGSVWPPGGPGVILHYGSCFRGIGEVRP